MGPPVVEALAGQVHDAGGYLDVHLMIERPERHVAAFAQAGADGITIHVEATPHANYALAAVRDAGCRAGLALCPGTPVRPFASSLDDLDLVLCMTVNPGWGGQPFLPGSLAKLERLRALARRRAGARGRRRDRRADGRALRARGRDRVRRRIGGVRRQRPGQACLRDRTRHRGIGGCGQPYGRGICLRPQSFTSHGPTILIVDDHPSFRASARVVLESDGFDVVGEAADGASALQECCRLRPEVVLLDVQLPDIDGFDVCEQITVVRRSTRP